MIDCQPTSEWTEFPNPINWYVCHAPFEVFLLVALVGMVVWFLMWLLVSR